jgi:Zn-dependent oligopeptidase
MSPPDANPLVDLPAAIPFAAIQASHVVPAIEALLAAARAEVRAIAEDTAPRTFASTLGRLEQATERLENALTVGGAVRARRGLAGLLSR